jgi:hypothetical protein
MPLSQLGWFLFRLVPLSGNVLEFHMSWLRDVRREAPRVSGPVRLPPPAMQFSGLYRRAPKGLKSARVFSLTIGGECHQIGETGLVGYDHFAG